MARTARCPTCTTPTKVPPDATAGTLVTCPGCDEQFVPPHLKVEPPRDPPADDEDAGYAARKADAKELPREREDGYDRDLRKKRRRRPAVRTDDAPMSTPVLMFGVVIFGIIVGGYLDGPLRRLGVPFLVSAVLGLAIVGVPTYLYRRGRL